MGANSVVRAHSMQRCNPAYAVFGRIRISPAMLKKPTPRRLRLEDSGVVVMAGWMVMPREVWPRNVPLPLGVLLYTALISEELLNVVPAGVLTSNTKVIVLGTAPPDTLVFWKQKK